MIPFCKDCHWYTPTNGYVSGSTGVVYRCNHEESRDPVQGHYKYPCHIERSTGLCGLQGKNFLDDGTQPFVDEYNKCEEENRERLSRLMEINTIHPDWKEFKPGDKLPVFDSESDGLLEFIIGLLGTATIIYLFGFICYQFFK